MDANLLDAESTSNGPESDGESAAEGDLNDNYEDIEAKLQQERIEYLQTLRKRELEDAEAARKMMQEEMLQLEREKLCHVMQDEMLARRLHEEEHNTSAHSTQPTSVYEHVEDVALSDDSDSEADVWPDDLRGGTNTIDFDNAVYFNETHNDEMLARTLHECEQEAASRRPTAMERSQQHDAYLARIMQNTERISAIRRQYMTQTTTTTQQPADVHRQMSVPTQPVSQRPELSTTPGGATPHRSQSASEPIARVENTVPAHSNGPERYDAATTEAEGDATSPTGAQGGVPSAGSKQHKSKTRKTSCKQQ